MPPSIAATQRMKQCSGHMSRAARTTLTTPACVRARAGGGVGGAMQCQTPTDTAAQPWMCFSTACLLLSWELAL